MSRSKRYTPISGNTKSKSEKTDKRLANRALRRAVKVALETGDEIMPLPNDVSNIYGMAKDGKRFFDSEAHPNLMRK